MRLWCRSMPYIRRHQNSSSRLQGLERQHHPVYRVPQIDQTTSRDVVLLGDGTEIITGSGDDEDDVDMGEAEEVDDSDIEEQIKKGQAESSKTNGEDRVQREGTPGPKAEEPTKDSSSTATPEEPKIKAATDGPASQ